MFQPVPSFLIGLPLLAYLLGSVPWGLVLTRMFTTVDIRRQGSGNIGANNVRRVAGTPLGLLTLAGDLLKGAAPVYLAVRLSGLDPILKAGFVSVVALAAFVGHLFPLYLKLKGGGKGVATAAGCFLVISPISILAALVVFLLIVCWSRRVSAGSLSAAVTLPVAVWWSLRSPVYSGCALLMAVLIVLRHKDNIRRLIIGSEPAIGKKSGRR
ncbi:MAG: glycerol-3-phosphate 1-O-acyltransferase PlsY [Deltaproteobacteria bacterium]|nr:glycerol-3-phosphate 1-O-acyltransferase PlsY [Deltaproteobacteria bacterium]